MYFLTLCDFLFIQISLLQVN